MKQLRVHARRSRADVAVTGILSESTLSRLENGIVATHWGRIKLLCELYGADNYTEQQLIKMSKAGRDGDGWFERYGEDVPEALAMFIGAEQAARQIKTYDPEVIPGALQSQEYARALFIGESPQSSPERIAFLVDGRMERRKQYWARRPDDGVLTVILGEAALAREVGSRATMSCQRQELREVSGERVEIRVLPWTVGAHPAIYGGYTIFEFSDPEDPTVIFFENYNGGQYLQDEEVVCRMNKVWKRLHSLAIPIKEYEDR